MGKERSNLSCFNTLCLLFILLPFNVIGQSESYNGPANAIKNLSNEHKQHTEKLYVHLDRSWYKSGDTLWYKVYLLNEKLSASAHSGLAYVELVNDSGRVVKRQMIKIAGGVGAGDIEIKRKIYPGNYTFRAYTNWMRNLGPEHFFMCKINIAPTGNDYWLVNDHYTVNKNKNVNLAMHFSDLALRNIGFKDVQLSVFDGTDLLLKKKAVTDPYGNLNFKFEVPKKNDYETLSLQAEDISQDGDRRKLIIPIRLKRSENTDVQFMPEGGNLLVNIPAAVAVKAIGEDGKSVEIKGQLYNNKMQQVVSFHSSHKGMGIFTFTPQAGETYTAKVTLPDSTIKTYILPAVKLSGITMQVKNLPQKDSIELGLLATPDMVNGIKNYMLIGQAQDSVYYSENVFFRGTLILKKIDKKKFPTGITKFILIDGENRPISQRLLFIDHDDELKIEISGSKKSYTPRDSIALQVLITNASGKPVKGNFSLAVTNDGEVRYRDINAENIVARMFLTADIKGNVEDPGYYFNKEYPDRIAELDNLLLTQGWTSYDWKQCFGPEEKIKFEVEERFMVTGRASNIFDGSIARTEITLRSDFPLFSLKTRTDNNGIFKFYNFPEELEKIDFKIQSTRDFNIGIKVDEFSPPEFTVGNNYAAPWYVNSDSTFVNYITGYNKVNNNNNTIKLNAADELSHGRKVLKEVIISRHHYRPPPPVRLILDEEDLRNARTGSKPLNLLDLLNQKESINHMYKLLIVDEHALVPYINVTTSDGQLEVDRWLQYYTTEDITEFRVERMFINSKSGELPALRIFVTTNAHTGIDEAGASVYNYHPMPLSKPHQFYSPKYTIKDVHDGRDKRSTVYWAPVVVTNEHGKATVSFFTTDQTGTYSLILEGSDMNGHIGYKRERLTIATK